MIIFGESSLAPRGVSRFEEFPAARGPAAPAGLQELRRRQATDRRALRSALVAASHRRSALVTLRQDRPSEVSRVAVRRADYARAPAGSGSGVTSSWGALLGRRARNDNCGVSGSGTRFDWRSSRHPDPYRQRRFRLRCLLPFRRGRRFTGSSSRASFRRRPFQGLQKLQEPRRETSRNRGLRNCRQLNGACGQQRRDGRKGDHGGRKCRSTAKRRAASFQRTCTSAATRYWRSAAPRQEIVTPLSLISDAYSRNCAGPPRALDSASWILSPPLPPAASGPAWSRSNCSPTTSPTRRPAATRPTASSTASTPPPEAGLGFHHARYRAPLDRSLPGAAPPDRQPARRGAFRAGLLLGERAAAVLYIRATAISGWRPTASW